MNGINGQEVLVSESSYVGTIASAIALILFAGLCLLAGDIFGDKEVEVWQDGDCGCEYLLYDGAITPRMMPSGRQAGCVNDPRVLIADADMCPHPADANSEIMRR